MPAYNRAVLKYLSALSGRTVTTFFRPLSIGFISIPCSVTPLPIPAKKVIHLTIQIPPDFRTGLLVMNFGVARVGKLVDHEITLWISIGDRLHVSQTFLQALFGRR
jgi:hypothetical protein